MKTGGAISDIFYLDQCIIVNGNRPLTSLLDLLAYLLVHFISKASAADMAFAQNRATTWTFRFDPFFQVYN
jgi:hypothetical protein